MSKSTGNCASKILVWLLVGVSSILIIFSCIAPVLFSYGSSEWDFTGTGQIGDTIGGTMSPFIGIAGVLAAFLAFYIQYEANKVQREQFLKSLNSRVIGEKIDSYNTLKLLVVDLRGALADFESRLKYLEDYIGDIEKDPYALAKLYRTPLSRYKRLRETGRMAVFKGFQYFIQGDGRMEMFSQLFSAIDYMAESLEELYRIVGHHEVDIFQDKTQVRNKLIEIEGQCVDYCNDLGAQRRDDLRLKGIILRYLESYRSLLSSDKETDFKQLKDTIERTRGEILHTLSLENRSPEVEKIDAGFSVASIVLNGILQKTNQIIPQFRSFLDEARGAGSAANILNSITLAIDTALAQTSEAQIRKEFLCRGL